MPEAEGLAATLTWTHPTSGPSPWVVLVLAGGGYGHVAIVNEAEPAAQWLAERGLSSAILDYRVAPFRHPVPLSDALEAYAQVRHAFGSRVIVWGFSAGGHLAGLVATEAEPRPDLLVLTYPVVSLRSTDGHHGSSINLLGPEATDDARDRLSLDSRVDERTPPTFVVHGGGDHAVPPEHSVSLWAALRGAGVPVEIHVYETGGHGGGLAGTGGLATWTARLEDWLSKHGAIVEPRKLR